jgi:putative redox protein
MGSLQSTIHWHDKMKFIGTGPSGHAAPMDTTSAGGGEDSAGSPKEMLLHALGGCTGMDVVTILRKMHLSPKRFDVVVTGETAEEIPREFLSFHLDYRFEGDDLPLESLERAVTLSQDKYCSVAATIRCCRPISWSITVNGQLLKSGNEPCLRPRAAT